ncbi:hypothetical protein BDP27DRAFT_1423827 [Rhodocollybia butyracea]|uniref:Uncharacterized protein n=1 Tax=Rhodocollybia butyracea TaxID=206335 RepID=A0A9P5PQU8_9AGAR|nr:hypothetical protein BDP27DRAFT_1423827 [Rhodocollybia butyracea]
MDSLEGGVSRRRRVARAATPVTLSITTSHLVYVLVRLEGLGLPVGSLDVPVSETTFIEDKTDTISLASTFSTLSSISAFSLGKGWFGSQPPALDAELKFIYSSFTKLPALAISGANPGAIPLVAFKNLQVLSITSVNPRVFLGWDRLSEGLFSLTIRDVKEGDFEDVFIGKVLEEWRQHRISEEEEEEPVFPPHAWSFLRHLGLPQNDMTFFMPELMIGSRQLFPSLTSLDLSSNLLISVPPSLTRDSLPTLSSLNLADNMIESVAGIDALASTDTPFCTLTTLNLAHNRLSSLCGLERLVSLRSVNVQHNYIDDPDEIGRLAVLPEITQVFVEGNPFTEFPYSTHESGSWKVKCFEIFWKEGRTGILIDGSGPGWVERRWLTTTPSTSRPTSNIFPQQDTPTAPKPVSAAYSPPTIAVGGHGHDRHSYAEATPEPTSPPLVAIGVGKPRTKKPKVKRIVELDDEARPGAEVGAGHGRRRTTSNASVESSKHTKSSRKRKEGSKDISKDMSRGTGDEPPQSFGQFVSFLAVPSTVPLPGLEPRRSVPTPPKSDGDFTDTGPSNTDQPSVPTAAPPTLVSTSQLPISDPTASTSSVSASPHTITSTSLASTSQPPIPISSLVLPSIVNGISQTTSNSSPSKNVNNTRKKPKSRHSRYQTDIDYNYTPEADKDVGEWEQEWAQGQQDAKSPN